MSRPRPRLLLDEHYPERLAAALRERGVDAVALVVAHPDLVGAPDDAVLRRAAAEARVVVTEDVSTFPRAARTVADHVGVVLCSPRRFPRTRASLPGLVDALVALVERQATYGPGDGPVVVWLEESR